MKASRFFRPLGVAALGVGGSTLIFVLIGVHAWVAAWTRRWGLAYYFPVFLVILCLSLLPIFSARHKLRYSRSFMLGSVQGLTAGYTAYWLAESLTVSGLDRIANTFRTTPFLTIIFLPLNFSFFPFLAWLYGATAAVIGQAFEQHFFTYRKDNRPAN